MTADASERRWTFLTNHAHVLLSISADHDARLRDIAEQVGITERAVHRIVADLVEEGYLTTTRVGRRNSYEVHPELRFRHPLLRDHQIDALFGILDPPKSSV
jgi:DNA-binding MarR family transcriptional regulator